MRVQCAAQKEKLIHFMAKLVSGRPREGESGWREERRIDGSIREAGTRALVRDGVMGRPSRAKAFRKTRPYR
jgi:hypothetical protein